MLLVPEHKSNVMDVRCILDLLKLRFCEFFLSIKFGLESRNKKFPFLFYLFTWYEITAFLGYFYLQVYSWGRAGSLDCTLRRSSMQMRLKCRMFVSFELLSVAQQCTYTCVFGLVAIGTTARAMRRDNDYRLGRTPVFGHSQTNLSTKYVHSCYYHGDSDVM